MKPKKQSKTKTKLLVLATLAIVLLSLFSIVYAQSSVASSYDFNNWSGHYANIFCVHPSSVNEWSGVGQTFSVSSEGDISAIIVRIKKEGFPNGDITCQLMTATSLNGVATGNVLIEAENKISTFSISSTGTNVTFSFDQTYRLMPNQPYAFVFFIDEASVLDIHNDVEFYLDGLIPTASGRLNQYYYDGWVDLLQMDLLYEVWVNGEPMEPEPTDPDPIPDDESLPWWVIAFFTDDGSFPWWIIILIIVALIILALVFGGKK